LSVSGSEARFEVRFLTPAATVVGGRDGVLLTAARTADDAKDVVVTVERAGHGAGRCEGELLYVHMRARTPPWHLSGHG